MNPELESGKLESASNLGYNVSYQGVSAKSNIQDIEVLTHAPSFHEVCSCTVGLLQALFRGFS